MSLEMTSTASPQTLDGDRVLAAAGIVKSYRRTRWAPTRSSPTPPCSCTPARSSASWVRTGPGSRR